MFGVWPENVKTVEVFCALETQWNHLVGMQGAVPVGLRYEALGEVWRMLGVKRRQRAEIFQGLQAMERAIAAPLFDSKG